MAEKYNVWVIIEEYNTDTGGGKFLNDTGTIVAGIGDFELAKTMAEVVAQKAEEVVAIAKAFNKLSRESCDRLLLLKELSEWALQGAEWDAPCWDKVRELLDKEKEEEEESRESDEHGG